MATVSNITPEFNEIPRPPAPVIDILTGATVPVNAAAIPTTLEAAAAPAGMTVGDYDQAVWSILQDAKRWSQGVYGVGKRATDAIGAAILLIVLSPLFLLITIVIKISSPGPALFRQDRLGYQGRPFTCLKFRTMVANAEQRLANDPMLRAAFESNYKIKDDPRVHRFGALLRRTSLDELPQLWNVLRGDMSLIGPRPIIPPEILKYGLYGQKLLSVRPGLSGLWQTCGRSDTTYEQRVRFDMLYIDHRSAWLDFKLLLLTVAAVYRKAGAC
jgi:lipopolysaccharide/colanic/teichoic acid biosynthesis glycosyltransferase